MRPHLDLSHFLWGVVVLHRETSFGSVSFSLRQGQIGMADDSQSAERLVKRIGDIVWT